MYKEPIFAGLFVWWIISFVFLAPFFGVNSIVVGIGFTIGFFALTVIGVLMHGYNEGLLNPSPKEYRIDKPKVFQIITDYFAEDTIHYGDSWHARTIDPKAGRLVYDIRWQDEHEKFEFGRKGPARKEYLRRHVTVTIEIEETEKGTTILYYDWSNKEEGTWEGSCNWLIHRTLTGIYQELRYYEDEMAVYTGSGI